MKIGILTLPLHTNYGGILQAYALQTVLKQMGHEVIIYQKRNQTTELPTWKYPFVYGKRLLMKLFVDKRTVIFVERKLDEDARIVRKYTNEFINKYINISVVKSLHDINLDKIDAIIVGSDQIWRPRYVKLLWKSNIQDVFLRFTHNWAGIRVAYAASFGVDEWEFSSTETKTCAKLIKKFNAISVREIQGEKLCVEHLGIKPTLVSDPTLLLKPDDYFLLIKDRISTGNKYLFNYILDETDEISELLSNISVSKGLELKSIRIKNKDKKVPANKRIVPPVESWLEALYDAEFVVTDSFHGCVFSIIFRKPFVAIVNSRRGASRFQSLFEMLGLENHLLMDVSEYLPDCSYYIESTTYDKLNNLQDTSLNFLLKNLHI